MNTNLKMVADPASDDDTIRRIDRSVESPPENSRIITITPAVATYILETYNKGNRPKKPAKIAEYADHMAAQTWWLTGDTVKFSDAKYLRDGQNRLMACVRSGVPFQTHVVFGIPDDAFALMDQGKNRGGSDILSIAGFTSTTDLAAAVRWAFLVEEGRVKQRDTLRPDETLRLVKERFPNVSDFIGPAAAVYRITGQPRGMVAALLSCFHKRNAGNADQFMTAWASGEHGGRFAVLGKLQKEIARLQANSSGRVHDVVRAALIVRTWNAFVDGRRGNADDFKWTPADDFPAIEG